MSNKIPTVTHEGILKVKDLEIKVLTLDNGQRIIPEDDFKKALDWLGLSEDDVKQIMQKNL